MSNLPDGRRWPLVKMGDARAGYMALQCQTLFQGLHWVPHTSFPWIPSLDLTGVAAP